MKLLEVVTLAGILLSDLFLLQVYNANLKNSPNVNKFKLHKLLTFLRFKRHSMSVYFFLHLFWEKFELTFARLQRYDFMTLRL